MTDMSVAHTIIMQLGGNKFVAMTGARHISGDANSLSFKLPGAGGFCKSGINHVHIQLMADDTYSVAFSRFRGTKCTLISMRHYVYVDMLQDIFTSETGLAVR